MFGKTSAKAEGDDENRTPSWLDTSKDNEFAAAVGRGRHVDGSSCSTPLLLLSSSSTTMEVDDHRRDARTPTSSVATDENGRNDNSSTNDNHRNILDLWSHYGTTLKSKRNSKITKEDDDDDCDEYTFATTSSSTGHQNDDTSRRRRKWRQGRLEKPRRSCGLRIFFFIESCAALTWLGLLICQLFPLVIVMADKVRHMDTIDLVLKVYVSIFACLFILVEYDPPMISFIQHSQFLQSYVSRGFLYSFIGVVCLEESYSEIVNDMILTQHPGHIMAGFAPFVQISAWCACALGVLYLCMGLLCLKRLRDRLYRDDKEKWEDYREREKRHWEENPFV